MICTPKGEAVFAYTNGIFLLLFLLIIFFSSKFYYLGNLSSPLYLDSPATFAYIFKNQSSFTTSTTTPDPSKPSPVDERVFSSDNNTETETDDNSIIDLSTYQELDYINDFDKELFANNQENDSDYSMFLAEHKSEEDQFTSTTNQNSDHPLPFPQSSATLSRSIPILYQLEIPSTTPADIPNAATLPISNQSDLPNLRNPSNLTEWNLSSLLSTLTPKTDSTSDSSKNEIPLNTVSLYFYLF